jgi:hypothetical protein
MDEPEDWPHLLRMVRNYTAGEVVTAEQRQAALESAMALGCSSVPGAVACSTSVAFEDQDPTFVTVAASAPSALVLDELQYRMDDGPCLTAAREGRVTAVEAMATDQRWPELSERALAEGVRQSVSLPLVLTRGLGALNVYGGDGTAFRSSEARRRAALLADVTSVLLDDPADDGEGLSAAQLQRILGERSVIQRAQGMVMARDGVSAEQAFHTLALASAEQSRRLADVAAAMLASVPHRIS